MEIWARSQKNQHESLFVDWKSGHCFSGSESSWLCVIGKIWMKVKRLANTEGPWITTAHFITYLASCWWDVTLDWRLERSGSYKNDYASSSGEHERPSNQAFTVKPNFKKDLTPHRCPKAQSPAVRNCSASTVRRLCECGTAVCDWFIDRLMHRLNAVASIWQEYKGRASPDSAFIHISVKLPCLIRKLRYDEKW